MGLFWIPNQPVQRWQRQRLNPRFDGAFLNFEMRQVCDSDLKSLNPRFDGAFLNWITLRRRSHPRVLIPDLMGLFWIQWYLLHLIWSSGLNPRFDGAFLNFMRAAKRRWCWVLIPDLMGLFWICITTGRRGYCMGLNPRFDGAFLNSTGGMVTDSEKGLNPRFDGAFLNSIKANDLAWTGRS